ncbi:hypothetical protein [Martelella alba]|uniref:hypothetical protein n=1 Tax=Martelella alba TaxID=2590451 RepID=UPI001484E28C|nr:hypothetical protein [Martelella alba]
MSVQIMLNLQIWQFFMQEKHDFLQKNRKYKKRKEYNRVKNVHVVSLGVEVKGVKKDLKKISIHHSQNDPPYHNHGQELRLKDHFQASE